LRGPQAICNAAVCSLSFLLGTTSEAAFLVAHAFLPVLL